MPETILLPGGLPVYISSVILGFSASLGLAWSAWQLPRDKQSKVVSAGLWALLAALLGGRLAFVFADWSYFKNHLAGIPQVYLGGISVFGALLGAILALFLVAVLSRQSFGELSDALLPLLAIVAVGGWISTYLSGVSYGAPSLAWWAVPTRDEWGNNLLRVPLQLVAAMLTLAWFALLTLIPSGKAPAGFKASLGLLGLSVILLVVSLLRVDPTQILNGLRLEVWASLGLTLGSLLLTLTLLLRRRSRSR